MKKLLLATLILLNILSLTAESVESVKADRSNYIWAEGNASSLEKARKIALDMLVNQISVTVESKYVGTVKQTVGTFSEEVNSIVKTYSNATLTNVEQIIINEEPDAKIFLYLKRSEVSKIFGSRKQKIMDNLYLGISFEEKMQIADALRSFYWSLMLLQSHPDWNSITFQPPGESKQMSLITWLPTHINDILGNLSFRVTESKTENEQKNLLLNITYKNQPVSNLDFSYFDGRNYSQVQGTTNGQSSLELTGASALLENLKLKVEYAYEYQARIDKELESVLDKVESNKITKSYYNIKTSVTPPPLKILSILNPKPQIIEPALPCKINEAPYQSRINRIVTAIQKKEYNSVSQLFTSDALESFNSLVKMGKARVIGIPIIKTFAFDDGVMCRPVPMMFSFANNNKKFSEEVIFYFNKDSMVYNITFGLSKSAINSITSNPKYAEKDQLTIINFLENYKTAFALKRIDYLESIFDDNALIIIGKYVRAIQTVESPYNNNKVVKYNKLDKKTYLKNLKQAFASQEFINIQFEESNIEKAADEFGSVYGIEIKQNYFSSNYGDQGYLFLMVDLNKEPLIKIRAWQPEKGAKGRTIRLGDIQ